MPLRPQLSRGIAARKSPLTVLALLLSSVLPDQAHPRTVTIDPPPTLVDRYALFEAVVHVTGVLAKNPFTQVTVSASVTPDGHEAIAVKGFCDSSRGDLFRVRFCPQKAADYSFTITYQDSAGREEFTGRFASIEAGRKGFIRLDPAYPNHFMYENACPSVPAATSHDEIARVVPSAAASCMAKGGHPFICSKTAWLIGDSDTWKGFLDKMVPRRENCIRFGVETNYYFETIGKDVWPWAGTRSSPDFSRFNPAVWRKLESVISYAAEKGILSEPVIFCTMRRDNPSPPDAEMELYWDYLLARLSPFTSIVTWQLYNEYASAKDYQAYMARYLREHDPYDHLVCSSDGTTSDALWPTEPWMDIAINHSCTDDSQLESRYHAIATRIHAYGKPAWCDETGRENRHGNNSGVHRRKQYWTWNICGDYWCYHSWEGCEGIDDLDYNGPGSEFLQFIRPFWEQAEWWKMQPANERVLNNPSSQYEWCLASDTETVVYMVNEAENASTKEGNIELAIGAGPFTAVSYSPADGSYYAPYKRAGYHPGGKLSLTHPAFADDLVLYVKHDNRPQPALVPKLDTSDGGTFSISWTGGPGAAYLVEYSPDLFQWLAATSLHDFQPPSYGKDGCWAWLDPSWLTTSTRFYRVER